MPSSFVDAALAKKSGLSPGLGADSAQAQQGRVGQRFVCVDDGFDAVHVFALVIAEDLVGFVAIGSSFRDMRQVGLACAGLKQDRLKFFVEGSEFSLESSGVPGLGSIFVDTVFVDAGFRAGVIPVGKATDQVMQLCAHSPFEGF